MLPGSGKFERTGIGSDRDAKEATNTAFNYLKANGGRISGSISTTTKDYIINYQDLQGIGMTGKLALPTLIALCSISLGRPVLSSTAILGEISHHNRDHSPLDAEDHDNFPEAAYYSSCNRRRQGI